MIIENQKEREIGLEQKRANTVQRESGIELYRIITMLVIVAHHYIVNSGIIELINQETGEAYVVLQDQLDAVFPGLLTTAFIILCWFLMAKKRMSPIKVMLLLVAVAFVGVLLGFFDPGLAY